MAFMLSLKLAPTKLQLSTFSLHSPNGSLLSLVLLHSTGHNVPKIQLCIPRKETVRPHSDFYIHVSVSDLYIPRILFGCSKISRKILGLFISLTDACMWKLGDIILKLCFVNNEVVQFHFWEYINRNQTFILDSHRSFICSVQIV
jgi:hypothetical protein